MRSRATFTEVKIPWRAWLLHDYARYWYAVTVLVLVVFGVGELARRWQPLSAATVLALLLLTGVILFVGVAGYALLWRREGGAGRWLVGRARSLKWFLRKLGLRLRGGAV